MSNMENEVAEFCEAVRACNACIMHDDRRTWHPDVVRIEARTKVLNVLGQECGAAGMKDAFGDAQANALLHLVVDEKRPCALYAYPANLGMRPVDAVVGFVDAGGNLTLAWDRGTRIFPMIGNSWESVPAVPPSTVWIVAAAFQTKYRYAIARVGQSTLGRHMKDFMSSPPVECTGSRL